MGTFHILTDVIFEGSDIYQLKLAMRKKVFSCSKSDPAPVWLDSENYKTFYLATLTTLSEEITVSQIFKKNNVKTNTKTF